MCQTLANPWDWKGEQKHQHPRSLEGINQISTKTSPNKGRVHGNIFKKKKRWGQEAASPDKVTPEPK